MPKMSIQNQEHFDKVKAHAKSLDLTDQLQAKLNRLEELAVKYDTLVLGYDFAPYSLSFSMYDSIPNTNCKGLHGGVIYCAGLGWFIHT